MPDLLGKASDWLEGQRHTHLTSAVSYRRGLTTVPAQATVGRGYVELPDEHGNLIRIAGRDFLITASELGALAPPLKGDQVTHAGIIFEVLNERGIPAWEWSDQNRQTYRIHCKRVGGNL
jgi:hypothetical protein